MPLGLRIFLVYFLFAGLAAWFVFSTVMQEIRPGVRQSTEETLVDTANLLAELLREDLKAGTLSDGRLQEVLRAYGERRPGAEIWGVRKTGVSHRIYVTDAQGIVLLDSSGRDVGKDYSRWNDVYLTLRGRYGARSTPEGAGEETSSVMYVGAPVREAGRIIGVVSVAKPATSLQPYIDRSQRRLQWAGGLMLALGLAAGAALSWWLSRSLRRLTDYAAAVSAGRRASLPPLRGNDELAHLAAALESMRVQLEGKAYVERYVQTLTHELKSPLSAIRGAAELLQGEIPEAERARFTAHIDTEAARIQDLIDKLLNLALIEQRQGLDERVEIGLQALAAELLEHHAARARQAGVRLENAVPAALALHGERFLVRQALANLLDNALDFCRTDGTVRIGAEAQDGGVRITVRNDGPEIPDFALPRLTERFYSLARPATGRKSSGLGLNFCNEVAALHGGSLEVRNIPGGVESTLFFPG